MPDRMYESTARDCCSGLDAFDLSASVRASSARAFRRSCPAASTALRCPPRQPLRSDITSERRQERSLGIVRPQGVGAALAACSSHARSLSWVRVGRPAFAGLGAPSGCPPSALARPRQVRVLGTVTSAWPPGNAGGKSAPRTSGSETITAVTTLCRFNALSRRRRLMLVSG